MKNSVENVELLAQCPEEFDRSQYEHMAAAEVGASLSQTDEAELARTGEGKPIRRSRPEGAAVGLTIEVSPTEPV
jgi:hypothetical protein